MGWQRQWPIEKSMGSFPTGKVRDSMKTAPPYWEDICPVCNTKCVSGCRCTINERTCANNHTWYWQDGKIIIGSTHGNQSTMKTLQEEFGQRLVTLNTGVVGLRGGLKIEAKAVDGDAPMMDFIATDETLDRYNELIKLNGWDIKNYLANPVVPDCHDYSSIARILGRSVSLTISDKMVNRVEFCLDNPLGNMAYKMAKGQFIKSESVGFIPLEWTNGNEKGQPDRTYTKAELLEISLVVVPANPGATIGLAVKSGAIEKADLKSLADFLKQFCTDEADPAAKARASGAGVNDAQLLQLARDLNSVLSRA